MTDLFPEVAPRIDGDMANDRYTTRETLDWCKRRLGVGGFFLDVAACLESHHAHNWFSRGPLEGQPAVDGLVHADTSVSWVDGLAQPWGRSPVWCNPPYDDLRPWVVKAWSTCVEFHLERPIIGMLIPDNRREQPFWQELIEPFRDGRALPGRGPYPVSAAVALGAELRTHSLPGRQKFGVPGNPEGIGQQSPPFGVVLLEWRFA